MKLNFDCFKDILKYLEENLTINIQSQERKYIALDYLKDNLSNKYSDEDIQYCVEMLANEDFITGNFTINRKHILESGIIEDITLKGHTYLQEIYDSTE